MASPSPQNSPMPPPQAPSPSAHQSPYPPHTQAPHMPPPGTVFIEILRNNCFK